MAKKYPKRCCVSIACILFLLGFSQQKDSHVQKRYETVNDYVEARNRVIEAELAMRFDAGITFSSEEKEADRKLMLLKQKEFERTREYFPPAHNFLKSKTRQMIDRSPVFEIMKRMPKGGILHVHGFLMGDYRWLIEQATYRPDCYIYEGKEEKAAQGALRFFGKPPENGWRRVSELRKLADDVEEFDEGLYRSVTLGEEDLTQPDVWEEFINCFRRSMDLFEDDEIRDSYHRRVFRDLIEENIQYIETRSRESLNIIEEVQRDNPEFKVKYIIYSHRSSTREQIAKELDFALNRRAANPDLIVGFDLVEEEDKEHTNLYFIDELIEARHKAEERGITLPLYLHSGESNWTENENVLDAILLDARRIGHGISLFKHPLLMQMVKDRSIAIEVCPISNQVLGYIADLRNHPAVLYINSGLPVVICPDDPALWKSTISHDFYEAFMSWSLDLKCLKQLAMNSLIYSAMEPEEKEKALEIWREKWDEFITWLNEHKI